MTVVLILVALLAGATLPIQAGVNAKLADYVGGPVWAATISFAVGAAVLFVVVLAAYRGGTRHWSDAPWWAWLGGGLGAVYVTASIVVAPRIGAAAFFSALVAAQLATSLLADRFGWVGYAHREITPLRLLGIVLVFTGAALVRVF